MKKAELKVNEYEHCIEIQKKRKTMMEGANKQDEPIKDGASDCLSQQADVDSPYMKAETCFIQKKYLTAIDILEKQLRSQKDAEVSQLTLKYCELLANSYYKHHNVNKKFKFVEKALDYFDFIGCNLKHFDYVIAKTTEQNMERAKLLKDEYISGVHLDLTPKQMEDLKNLSMLSSKNYQKAKKKKVEQKTLAAPSQTFTFSDKLPALPEDTQSVTDPYLVELEKILLSGDCSPTP